MNIMQFLIITVAMGFATSLYAEDAPAPATATPPAKTPDKDIMQNEKQERKEYLDDFKREMQRHREAAHEHMKQQDAENLAFRATLEGKSPEEKDALIKQHIKQQTTENHEFFAKHHGEIQAYLKEKRKEVINRINASNATDDAKAAKIKELEARWAKNDAHYAKQHEENKAVIEKSSGDGIITPEEQEKIKEHIKKQIQENAKLHADDAANKK